MKKQWMATGALATVAACVVGSTVYYLLLGCNGGGCGSKPAQHAEAKPAPAAAPAPPGAPPKAKYRLSAPGVLPAPPALAALVIAIDPTFIGDGRAAQNAPVLNSLRDVLAQAGYRIGNAPGPADLTARLSFQSRAPFGVYSLALYQNGLLLDTVYGDVNAPPDHELECEVGCPLHGVMEAVSALGRSGRVLNFAATRTGAPPPVAAAPVAQPADPYAGAAVYVTATPQPNAYALIIGIEKYRDVPAPTGARRDAEQMAVLLRKTLGVPEANIVIQLDDRATRSDIEKQLRWLRANVPAGGRVYFFFSGHGAPDPASGTSYIVPYDGDPKYLSETALVLQDVLRSLAQSKAHEVLAIVDSCFSGAGGRSVLPPGTRPLVKVKESKPAAHVALFSASSGAEISGPGKNGGGLFTSTLLEALGSGKADVDGDGAISLGELVSWVKPRVAREARRDNREQTPAVQLGDGMPAANDFIVVQGVSAK